MLKKQEKLQRRHKRVRAKVIGTAKVPRLCVSRSSKHISAQLINDEKRETILSLNDKNKKGEKTAKAAEVGKEIAAKAIAAKIKKVVFDRSGHKYHGRVKALAEGAREAGLKF